MITKVKEARDWIQQSIILASILLVKLNFLSGTWEQSLASWTVTSKSELSFNPRLRVLSFSNKNCHQVQEKEERLLSFLRKGYNEC